MNQDALKVALEAIRRKDRFESELRTLLIDKGFEAEPVVDYLKGRKFLDDERVTQVEAERLTRKGLGPDRIRAELERRGAPDDLIDLVLSVSIDPADVARAAFRKKFPNGADRAKAMRFLLSRGFDEELAASILEDVPE